MEDNRNLILAIVLSMLILFGYNMYAGTYETPPDDGSGGQISADGSGTGENGGTDDRPNLTPPPAGDTPNVPAAFESPSSLGAARDRETVISESPRVAIKTPRLDGSIRLEGGRLDDLTLLDYRQTQKKDSPNVVLLSPAGTKAPYFAEYGWVGTGIDPAQLPGRKTPWQASGDVLAPGTPVTLTWDNGQGLVFSQIYEIDENYLVTVTQQVKNNTGAAVSINPYGLINRTGTPEVSGFFILHEGPLGIIDGSLEEIDYDELKEDGTIGGSSTGGWIGITDKYWLMALIPDQTAEVQAQFQHSTSNRQDKYQANFVSSAPAVAPGSEFSMTTRLFAGAKENNLIDAYKEEFGITLFDRAIDWGWFWFLTQPIFWLLDYFYHLIGNFGVAILLLTVLIKAMFFTLANKSYVSMSAMRKLQPKMTALRERHKDDPVKQREAMMKLYQEEKVNPVSGCLPILIQIPVFFALYKVLFVSIEMRHAPFFGWVKDLSAPDPLLITNLFGLIPWDPPSIIAIGVWPLLMGITMWGQQKLNPAPPDPVQAKIFMFLPILFTFLLASFPVGLVIYWTWNNMLTIAQQWVIMKRHGAFDEAKK